MLHFSSGILLLLERTQQGHWSPGIGDPTLVGWLTVVAYFGAAWLCLKASRMSGGGEHDGQRVLAWRALAFLMLCLGINKQLDLQSLLTEVGKAIAMRDGWYANRRGVQVGFIGLVVMGGGSALLLMLWGIRRHLRELGLAYIGACFIVVFVIVRATSFHRVDLWLASGLGGLKLNGLLELGGIGCVATGAGLGLTRHRKQASGSKI